MSKREGVVVWVCDSCGAEERGGAYASLAPDPWRTVKYGDKRWDVCGGCAAATLKRVREAIPKPPEPPANTARTGPYR